MEVEANQDHKAQLVKKEKEVLLVPVEKEARPDGQVVLEKPDQMDLQGQLVGQVPLDQQEDQGKGVSKDYLDHQDQQVGFIP